MTARTARSRPTLGAALGFGLAALSALALSAGPAQAAFPGTNGRVLVQWGDHIVSYAKSGGDRRDLGQGVGPRFSPDAKKIAFSLGGDLYVMNANGTGKTRVTSGPRKDLNPAWAPDGKRIVFSSAPTATKTSRSLSVLTVATKQVAPLTRADDGCAFDPIWAATGRVVVYVDQCPTGAGSSSASVRKVDTTTGVVSTIIPVGGLMMGGQKFGLSGFSRPDITPDGTKIAWRAESLEGTEDGGVALSSLTGTGSRWVSFDLYWVYAGDPIISPDGKTIIFGYGNDNDQIDSACLTSPCAGFYLDPPDVWASPADWGRG